MEFKQILKQQIKLHPTMQPQDVMKLCFQAAFGGGHLLKDVKAAEEYFNQEFEAVTCNQSPIYEQISEHFFRINIASWKAHEIPKDWLFVMFRLTTKVSTIGTSADGKTVFQDSLAVVEEIARAGMFVFSIDNWLDFKSDYLKDGIRSVHHSDHYRKKENPAYRVVSSEFIRLIPLLQKLANLNVNENKTHVIAIDGRSASGKTTIAKQLEKIIGAGIIQMDDFFLPGFLRSEARFAEPGGNVHYERFTSEVIPHLASEAEFSYQIFDCSIMDFGGYRSVKKSKWRIVEGAYSCHPKLNNYMSLRVFSDISSSKQIKRIQKREDKKSAEMYLSRWIPMEETYLKSYAINEKADLVL